MEQWFKEFFDKYYYETYVETEPEDRNIRESKFIISALNLPKGSSILDLGCGYARHAVYLAKWGYSVVGFDLSDYLLKRAKERCKKFNVEIDFIRGDMRKMFFEERFDGIYMFYTTFGYFSDEENMIVLENIFNALKRKGKILIDVWNKIRVYSIYLHRNNVMKNWYNAGGYMILEEGFLNYMDDRVVVKRIFYRNSKKIVEKTFSLKIYSVYELSKMLRKVGLRILKIYGDYRGNKYSIDSPRIIIVGEKCEKIF